MQEKARLFFFGSTLNLGYDISFSISNWSIQKLVTPLNILLIPQGPMLSFEVRVEGIPMNCSSWVSWPKCLLE